MAALFVRQCGNAVRSGTTILKSRNLTLGTTRYSTENEQEWRYRKGFPRNPNAYGPLTDNRDFSFIDGRPVPLGVGQAKRAFKQRGYAEKILQHVKEMDFAVERHKRIQLEAEEKRQAVLGQKFKPKGHLLLKKSTNES